MIVRLPHVFVCALLPLYASLPLLACDKGEREADDEAHLAALAPPPVEARELSTLFMGDAPTLPGPLAKLRLGSTLEASKQAWPELPACESLDDPAYEGVSFSWSFDAKTQLARARFTLAKAEAVEAATEAWGEPQRGEGLGKEILWWFNPATGLRAAISDGFGDEAQVEFTPYMPVSVFLGEGPELAFEAGKPLLGMSQAELARSYAEVLTDASREDSATAEAAALMAKPEASTHLDFPPLEWGEDSTRVNFLWTEEGTISHAWFKLDFEPHPAARDELFTLLEAKWGEAEQEDDYGDTLFVFSEEPFISVEEDTISGGWDIFMEPKRDLPAPR